MKPAGNKRVSVDAFAIIGGLFALIGTVFLIVAIGVIINRVSFLKGSESATATVSYNISGYTITYEVKGKQYVVPLNYTSSDLYEGKNIDVYYKPDNPANAKTKMGLSIIGFIFTPLGLVFAIIGYSFLIVNFKKRKQKRRLLETGQVIYARIIDIYRNSSVQVNGRSAFVIECVFEDEYSGESRVFKSENMFVNPYKAQVGYDIPVYLDRENPRKYYVDVRNTY